TESRWPVSKIQVISPIRVLAREEGPGRGPCQGGRSWGGDLAREEGPGEGPAREEGPGRETLPGGRSWGGRPW
uniref:Uncharacterized protein n=1 Tax=Naja naja TaxID=35670 RepID=A0A8C6YF42_NAJNA